MPDQDDKEMVPFIIRLQGQQHLDRIQKFVDDREASPTARILEVVEYVREQYEGAPAFSAADKEKWVGVFTDPGGVTLHAFADRDGMWRARVTCADGSQLYTQPHHTMHGLFVWFGETASLIRWMTQSESERDK